MEGKVEASFHSSGRRLEASLGAESELKQQMVEQLGAGMCALDEVATRELARDGGPHLSQRRRARVLGTGQGWT